MRSVGAPWHISRSTEDAACGVGVGVGGIGGIGGIGGLGGEGGVGGEVGRERVEVGGWVGGWEGRGRRGEEELGGRRGGG